MDAEKNISNNLTLDELSEVLDSGAIIKARNLLNALYPSEIADVIDIDRGNDQILNTIQSRAIDVLVGRLRTKLEKNPKNPMMIKTERGIGYVLASEVVIEND